MDHTSNLFSAFVIRSGELIWLGASSTREEAREIITNSPHEWDEYSFVVKTEDFTEAAAGVEADET